MQTDADEERDSREPLAASLGATHHYGGVELSMDGVTLRRPKPLWLRRRMVARLDSCSLRIPLPPDSVHCIMSLSSTYGRRAGGVGRCSRCRTRRRGGAGERVPHYGAPPPPPSWVCNLAGRRSPGGYCV